MLTNTLVNKYSLICSSVKVLTRSLPMTRKKITIDVEDSEGAKYKFSLEGNVTRDKMLKIFELMDLINIEEPEESPQLDSIGSKIWDMVDKHFPLGKFTSSEMLEKYEDEYWEPTKLSSISTYMPSCATKGKIVRERQGRESAHQAIRLAQTQV